MKVTAEDVTFDIQPTYAQINFVQAFSSGSYKDRGPKQLVAVPVGGTWLISREDMISSDYERPDPCRGDHDCGDADFYANVDWDAYSDDEDGERYVVQEMARRYRPDIDRCLEQGKSQSSAGQIQGTIVEGGYVRAVQTSGFGDEANGCIKRVAENTWLFADPKRNAQNDFAPESLKDGKVPFRISLQAEGTFDRTKRTGPRHKAFALEVIVIAPAKADSTSWDGPPGIITKAITSEAISMLELADPVTALAKYFASGIIEDLALPDIEGKLELIVNGVVVDSITLGVKHDSLTPSWQQATLTGVDVANAHVRVTLIDRDLVDDDPVGTFEIKPSDLEAAFAEKGIHSIDVRGQTNGQVLLARFSVN